jgi:hypothetical protein
VLPELLGTKKIVSEDAVRRGFKAIGADEGKRWLQPHLDCCTAPLLAEPWIFDADSTVKPLYWHQEGAVVCWPRVASLVLPQAIQPPRLKRVFYTSSNPLKQRT